jgi:2-C-methyl-D-erythritol 4-phosphate cytidylyltransferase
MKVSAILVAAGSSRRMGFDKLAADLAGESVLVRSILAFEACPGIAEIRVVTNPEKFAGVAAAVARLGITKFVETLPGGAERHLSVNAGLSRVDPDCDLVAVHDAARPLVTPAAISRCIAAAAEGGAATLAHRVADTLKRGNTAGEVVEAVSREDLWAMETPQIFSTVLLREAYTAVLARGELVTDEVSAVAALGHPVKLVENPEPNLKITVPGDLAVAEAVLRGR